MYALVVNSAVVNTSNNAGELIPYMSFPAGITDQELQDRYGIYLVKGLDFDPAKQKLTAAAEAYLLNGNVYDAVAVDLDLAEVKRLKLYDIGVAYAAKSTEGFNYSAVNFQLDETAQKNMLIVRVQILAGIASPHGGYWRATNNQMVPMDDTAVVTFINAACAYGVNVLKHKWTLDGLVAVAGAVKDVLAIEPNSGWPAN